jgi:spore coat protein U-like protein
MVTRWLSIAADAADWIPDVNHEQKSLLTRDCATMIGMRGPKSSVYAKFGALIAAALMASTAVHAAPATGDAQVALVTPLSFINYRNLDFGRVIPSATAGTVSISETNIRSTTGGVIVLGNDFQAARFAGMGAQNQRVRIRITPTTLTLTGPGPSMTVTNLSIGPAPSLQQIGNSPNYRILPANGVFWFTVGGQLNVGANQAAGAYSGTFTATLDYQ